MLVRMLLRIHMLVRLCGRGGGGGGVPLAPAPAPAPVVVLVLILIPIIKTYTNWYMPLPLILSNSLLLDPNTVTPLTVQTNTVSLFHCFSVSLVLDAASWGITLTCYTTCTLLVPQQEGTGGWKEERSGHTMREKGNTRARRRKI